MIFIVSGFMRSGTSMMMKALAAGGMTPAYSRERDARLNDHYGDQDKPNGYRPNQQYFELNDLDYGDMRFPLQYEGKLIKCLWPGLGRMRNCQARVLIMRRPREEIYLSCLAAFGTVPQHVADHNFDQFMSNVVEVARDRRSFLSVDEVWYQDVLDRPLAVFQQLKRNGWPIDPCSAASVPQRTEKRFVA